MRDFISRGLASRGPRDRGGEDTGEDRGEDVTAREAKRQRVKEASEWVGRKAKGWVYEPVEVGSSEEADSDDNRAEEEEVEEQVEDQAEEQVEEPIRRSKRPRK